VKCASYCCAIPKPVHLKFSHTSGFSASEWSAHPVWCSTRQEGSLYERNQHVLWSADRAVHNPAAPLDAQGETADHGVWITKDVPIMRIDHVSIKGKLLGVWQAFYGGRDSISKK
jgi:hypothetical protein